MASNTLFSFFIDVRDGPLVGVMMDVGTSADLSQNNIKNMLNIINIYNK
jgi:hypothetical protein